MQQSQQPLISVGMPVFNGEQYLDAAIESLLEQTYTNLQIIICDNASTDRTQSICTDYERRDKRITCIRNPENIGGSPNYNKCFSLARGEYFLWLAHDDVLEPTFAERCLHVLQASPKLGLCHCAVTMIDGAGTPLGVNDNALSGTRAAEPSRRLRAILREDHYCQSVFSMYRSDVLRRTGLLGSHHHSDRVLLAEMALLAPFGYIAEPLFRNRLHDQRYTAKVKADAWSAWHDPRSAGERVFPLWKAYARYFDAVRRLVPERRDGLMCRKELVLWWFVGANAGHMLIDALAAFEPRVFRAAQIAKHRLSGSRADWLVARARQKRG